MAGNGMLLCIVQELVTSYWLQYLCYREKPLPTEDYRCLVKIVSAEVDRATCRRATRVDYKSRCKFTVVSLSGDQM
jgi:hypothetical protein